MSHHNDTMTNLLQGMNEIITKPSNQDSQSETPDGTTEAQSSLQRVVQLSREAWGSKLTDETKPGSSSDVTYDSLLRVQNPLAIKSEAVGIESPTTPTLKERLMKRSDKLKIVDNPRCFSAVDRETITLYCK